MPAVLGGQQVWDEGCLDFLISSGYLLSMHVLILLPHWEMALYTVFLRL